MRRRAVSSEFTLGAARVRAVLRVRGMARSGLVPLGNRKAKANREMTGR